MPKKKQQKTRRTKDPVKRIQQELRAFRQKLHRMVDKCVISWEGEPYKQGSTYRFIIPPDLVNLIIGLVMQTQQAQEKQRAEDLTVENARMLQGVNASEEPEGEPAGALRGPFKVEVEGEPPESLPESLAPPTAPAPAPEPEPSE